MVRLMGKIIIGAKCPTLPTIKNGFVVESGKDYYFSDEARVQCNRGYKLTGSNIISCGPNQRFENVPTCEGKVGTNLPLLVIFI